MRRPRIAVVFAVLAGTALAGCMYPKAAEPPAPLTTAEVESARAEYPEVTGATLTAGRDLFVAHCNECHGHPDVTAIAEDEWPGIVKEMGRKAKLDGKQAASVLRFIQSVRAARAKSR